MLGRYENFPENVHRIAIFNFYEQAKAVQQAILSSFCRLNKESFDVGAITPYLQQPCEVSFEFGVADGFDFVFLDDTELEKCLERFDESELQVLDFFFTVRYYRLKGNKKIPLRFDYAVIRFSFYEDHLETRIRHEKGTQRISIDDLTDFISKQINAELSNKGLGPIVLRESDKVRIEFSDW
jgi:hypothetical protein